MSSSSAVRIGGKVDKVDGRCLTYADFVECYMKPNLPVVLTGLLHSWPSTRDWVLPSADPNLSFFARNFPNSLVQVAECGKRECTDQKGVEMMVSDFIDYWIHFSDGQIDCTEKPLLYLKDWHFIKEYPDYVAYTTPSFFLDDWLNLYLNSHHLHRDSDIRHDKNEANCSDYRFVYMGPKGTWTPLHADVFRSYSWSTNVCGKKLWYLLPPSQCHLVFDRNLKNSVYDIRGDVSEKQFPDFKKAVWLECIQESNEIIFVPSGWYHQVHNLEDTISINHNWFNVYNISLVWELLLKDYKEAKEYIEDIRDICDDFESLCQRNLAANTGMNFYDFFILITRFALAFMVQISLLQKVAEEANKLSIENQLVYNLTCLRSVAASMKGHEAFSEENLSRCSLENRDAYSDIKQILMDEEFLKLCCAVSKTYRSIFGEVGVQEEDILISDMDCFEGCDYRISGPVDLIKLIDCAIKKKTT